MPTVTDILRELEKPGRDPRPAFRTATFADGVETMADLAPGMVLEGTVTNVAAFGAFVDIGVHQDGLVHVSAMSRTFVSDPREVAKPGDVVRVRVLGVDIPRKRISLTLRLDDEPDGRGADSSRRTDVGAAPPRRPGDRPGGTSRPRPGREPDNRQRDSRSRDRPRDLARASRPATTPAGCQPARRRPARSRASGLGASGRRASDAPGPACSGPGHPGPGDRPGPLTAPA